MKNALPDEGGLQVGNNYICLLEEYDENKAHLCHGTSWKLPVGKLGDGMFIASTLQSSSRLLIVSR